MRPPRRLLAALASLASAALIGHALLAATPALAQQLPDEWVAESDRLMRQNRTARLRVVVLNAEGSPVPGAVVEARQTRHHLPLGFVATRSGLDGIDLSAPVYRQFNTLSLDRLTQWRDAHPRPNAEHPMLAARRVAHQARQHGLDLRLGPVLSEDPAHNPDWVAALPSDQLAPSLTHRLDVALADFAAHAGPSTQIDLLGHGLSHQHLTDTLGQGLRRSLFDHARAAAPHASLAVRFTDALAGHRRARLAAAVADLREDFIDADLVAIEERIEGGLQRAPLIRTLDAIDRLGYGVTLASLDVGGPSPEAAAYSLELLLRTLAPHPACRGIVFNTVVAPLDDAPAPLDGPAPPANAGLIDTDGRLTPAGRVVEQLFGQTWRSNELAVTDPELAAADFTLFVGTYDLTVMLPPTPDHPDGQTFTHTLHLPPSDQPRFTALQPLRKSD